MSRATILQQVLGKPWRANAKGPDAFDCWHLAVYIERVLFDRTAPEVNVPDNPTWSWMVRALSLHPERENWTYVPPDTMGLIRAKDGALVLMARSDRPAHVGVWLAPERRIIHTDPIFGVVCDSLVDLRTKSWNKLRFYEPRA